jgi:hypothetical protein
MHTDCHEAFFPSQESIKLKYMDITRGYFSLAGKRPITSGKKHLLVSEKK